jgi:hypothetical protein
MHTLECQELLDQLPKTRWDLFNARIDAGWFNSHKIREEYIRQYSFAILTPDTIEEIRPYGPILEVGAGTGYWAYELTRAGVSVLATDPEPLHHHGCHNPYPFQKHWCTVKKQTAASAIRKNPDMNVLTVWPEYNASWTGKMLEKYTAKHLIYVGEPAGGCTGDDNFHQQLETRFELVKQIDIPQFFGIHDYLYILQNKVPSTTKHFVLNSETVLCLGE